MSWHMRQAKKREDEEEDDDEEEEEEERKGFLGFPLGQSSPNSAPIHSPPEPQRLVPSSNGERRPRGRPPKNWPWGKGRDSHPGRPPKIRPVDDDDEDDETEQEKTAGSASSPPSLFSLDRQTEPISFHKLGMTSHSITPSRRGRPPRKKRGPKPRPTDGPGDSLGQLPGVPRMSDSPVRKSCFSESSEEEEEEEDDEDEDDEDRRACSPPMLTKPAMGLKCKVSEEI